MISFHKQFLKKALYFSILWFLLLLLCFYYLSHFESEQHLRILPLLSDKFQYFIWDLSANISQLSFSKTIHDNGLSLWLFHLSRNFTLFLVFAFISITLGAVPYMYFQLIGLALTHLFYYEVYTNLLSLGMLSHQDFAISLGDLKFFFVIFTFSLSLMISLWLTEEISRRFSQRRKGHSESLANLFEITFTALLKLYLPCAVLSSLILSF